MGWVRTQGILTIGDKFRGQAIPTQWPPLRWPEWGGERVRAGRPVHGHCLAGRDGVSLSAVVAGESTGDRQDSNTELIAQGVAHLVCLLFGGLSVTGAIARTSANFHHGAQSPIAGVVHSLTLLVIVWVAFKLAVYVPMVAMLAVRVMMSLRMGEWHELFR